MGEWYGAAARGPSTALPSAIADGNFAQDDRAFNDDCQFEVVVKEHQYFVYIVASRTGTLYIGMTNSVYRRALQHKAGEIEGFSSKYGCDRLVYYESFDDVHKAIGREKQLKG